MTDRGTEGGSESLRHGEQLIRVHDHTLETVFKVERVGETTWASKPFGGVDERHYRSLVFEEMKLFFLGLPIHRRHLGSKW